MSANSELSRSKEYLSFRSSIPLRKIIVDSGGMKGWKVYDSGPKTIKCPLICLPPVSGTADIFFKQILSLTSKGYRVISTEPPTYWDITKWCDGFRRLLDYMELDRVHIFGASLGGFLAQKFAEINSHRPRVVSLILCNSFIDTSVFSYGNSTVLFWMLPSLILKKMIMSNFAVGRADGDIIDAIDFMVEKLDSLSQSELASRLTMNCATNYVQPHKMGNLPITIIDVFDEYALSNVVREDMYKCYPSAKLAHLKSGGNFPYLSRSADVNLHLQIHLRQFEETEYSASDMTSTNLKI